MSSSVEQIAKRAVTHLQQIPLTLWQMGVMLGLVLCLCFSVAQIFWVLVASLSNAPLVVSDSQNPPVNIALAERSPSVTGNVDIAALSQMDIFGKAGVEAQAVKVPVVSAVEQNAPETKLKLVLKGIVDSSKAGGARAIIADGAKQALYALGDSLPQGRGVTLAKVMSDKVILENNGRFESLPLYSDEPTSSARLPSSRARSSVQSSSTTRSARNDAAKSVVSGKKSLADVIKVSMVRESGKVVGYRVRPGKERDLFNSLGLKPNDIVVAVNGVALNSSSKAMEVYKSMREETSASFDIKRGEETLSLNIDTN